LAPVRTEPAAALLSGVDAVLLDMDGTLVDSDAAVDRAWIRWSAEHGIDAATVLRLAPGRPAISTVRLVAAHLDEPAVRRAAGRQSELQVADVAGTAALPGAAELLATLDRLALPWAVVTSADIRLARARLAEAGISPPLLVTIEDVRHGKPHPEGYLLAAARLGADPDRCLVVEDSPPGIEAGRRAGARVAGLRGLPADVQVRDLRELARLLRAAPP
jgi:HAD superfamily hydrolase (TIGR01509 family)